MRWLLSLQAILGLGALFGLGYVSTGKLLENDGQINADQVAEARAEAAAFSLRLAWRSALDSHRIVLRALAESDALNDLGGRFPQKQRVSAVKEALEVAASQVADTSRAVVVQSDGNTVAATEQGASLVSTKSLRDAMAGATVVRIEMVDNSPWLVGAARLGEEGQAAGAFALAVPIDGDFLRRWAEGLSSEQLVALAASGQIVAATTDIGAKVPMEGDPAWEHAGTAYRVARHRLDDGTVMLGLAPVDSLAAQSTTGIVERMVLILGAASLLLVLLLVWLSPAQSAAAASTKSPAVPADTPAPTPSVPEAPISPPSAPPAPAGPGSSPVELDFPKHPVPASPSEQELQAQLSRKTVPSSPAPTPVPQPQVQPVSPPPSPAASIPPPAASSIPPPPAASSIPFVSPAPAATAPPPSDSAFQPLSPFDAIASAAVSRPPVESAPPAVETAPVDPQSDLPVPKGMVPPELAAAQRAEAQRMAHNQPSPQPSFSPAVGQTDLPALKDSGMPPGPQPSTAVPLPGSSGNPWRAQPPASGQPPAPAAPPAADQWAGADLPAPKDSVIPLPPKPEAPMGSNAPASAPASDEVKPYDEAHYRSVYEEFVSSKRQLGEAVENITFDGFRVKLRNSEQQLLDRHGCRAVRFQVLVKDRTVSLRPQLVR